MKRRAFITRLGGAAGYVRWLLSIWMRCFEVILLTDERLL
jgi:hypothetical protein